MSNNNTPATTNENSNKVFATLYKTATPGLYGFQEQLPPSGRHTEWRKGQRGLIRPETTAKEREIEAAMKEVTITDEETGELKTFQSCNATVYGVKKLGRTAVFLNAFKSSVRGELIFIREPKVDAPAEQAPVTEAQASDQVLPEQPSEPVGQTPFNGDEGNSGENLPF